MPPWTQVTALRAASLQCSEKHWAQRQRCTSKRQPADGMLRMRSSSRVGSVSLDDVLGAFATVEASVGRAVNPTVYSIAEYKSKLASGNHFLSSLIRGK